MSAKVYCPWHGQWDGHPDGVEMNLYSSEPMFGGKILYWYECPVCDEASPSADTEIQAYINARRRFIPPQEPMHPSEIRSGVRVWVEFPNMPITPTILMVPKEGNDNLEVQAVSTPVFSAPLGSYGRKWRCWHDEPTDDEREAAEWEA